MYLAIKYYYISVYIINFKLSLFSHVYVVFFFKYQKTNEEKIKLKETGFIVDILTLVCDIQCNLPDLEIINLELNNQFVSINKLIPNKSNKLFFTLTLSYIILRFYCKYMFQALLFCLL